MGFIAKLLIGLFLINVIPLAMDNGQAFGITAQTFDRTTYVKENLPTYKKVLGYVFTASGEPLVGATVQVKGESGGTITNTDGAFSLSVDSNAVLQISFIGYKSTEVPVQGKTEFEIILFEDPVMLDPVIITSLGIERKESSLTYAVTKVKGDELRRVKDPNIMNTLTGKVAGVRINKNSSGLGGSVKVSIRGIRSVVSDNQPLYVIDGVPILNTISEQAYSAIGGTANAGNRDSGDGISNLNPEDVESISVLKGAPAAALYGSQAANGVVLITTKKGKAEGMREISFSTGLTFDKAFCLPKMQNNYGVSDGADSWGSKQNLTPRDNLKDFFRTGITSITSISVSQGHKKLQNYFSYANTTGKGIIDKNHLAKHNLNLRETSSLFDDRLKLDGNINMMRQVMENKPTSGGFYMNPLVGLYRFPRGEDLSYYRENFEVYDPNRQLHTQNWHTSFEDFEQNPYWIVNRIQSKDSRFRIMLFLSAHLKVTDWLDIQIRGSQDYVNDKARQKFYASTAPALSGLNGRYIEMDYQESLLYGDVMALVKKKWNKISLNAALGASMNDKTVNSIRYDSKTASLKYPNVFNLANIIMNSSASIDQQIDARRQLQSLYATAQIGYKDVFFVDVTARNDWASTLAYTDHERTGFFYPSASTSFILSKLFSLPSWITFGKVRAAYSKVGNDIPLFITNSVSHIGAGGEIQANDAAPFKDMEPEMTHSVEVGAEWSFFRDRLNVNATFYRVNTHNQFFKLPSLSGDKYAYRYVNAGDIQNVGWEVALNIIPVMNRSFVWKTMFNFSSNKNRVIELHEQLKEFVYGPTSFSSSYAMKLIKGGSIGDIYGKAFVRDASGNIVYETKGDNKGLPLVEGDGNTVKVGNANPVFLLGWNNTLTYKGFSLYFLVDCRYGGEVLSQTQADMDMYGVSKATADARDAGSVTLEGRRIENVKGFYKNVVGGRAGVTEYYMYDATNIRLREFSLSYRFPQEWVSRSKIFKSIQFSLVGRNLFFIYKNAPFDPDLVLSTGNDNQGIDVYGMPTTRSLGFSIQCEF